MTIAATTTIPHPTAEITAARRAVETTLARQQARNRVKEELRRRGWKLASTTAAQLYELAKDYLARHEEECFSRAREIIAVSVELQKMIARGEREEQRRAVRKGTGNRTLPPPKANVVEATRP
jgi:hypothetical protein